MAIQAPSDQASANESIDQQCRYLRRSVCPRNVIFLSISFRILNRRQSTRFISAVDQFPFLTGSLAQIHFSLTDVQPCILSTCLQTHQGFNMTLSCPFPFRLCHSVLLSCFGRAEAWNSRSSSCSKLPDRQNSGSDWQPCGSSLQMLTAVVACQLMKLFEDGGGFNCSE